MIEGSEVHRASCGNRMAKWSDRRNSQKHPVAMTTCISRPSRGRGPPEQSGYRTSHAYGQDESNTEWSCFKDKNGRDIKGDFWPQPQVYTYVCSCKLAHRLTPTHTCIQTCILMKRMTKSTNSGNHTADPYIYWAFLMALFQCHPLWMSWQLSRLLWKANKTAFLFWNVLFIFTQVYIYWAYSSPISIRPSPSHSLSLPGPFGLLGTFMSAYVTVCL